MSIVQEISELFSTRGDSEYGGEAVTQLEHALQSALLAEDAKAPESLVVAALLHDIGHLLHELPSDAPKHGIDDHHEASGYKFLQSHFSAAVSEPVRLHVAAKRYLCTVEDDYLSQLSEPSLLSFQLQGGKMSVGELDEFRRSPHWEAALELRRWDDLAKVQGRVTAPIEHYLPMIEIQSQADDEISR